MAPDSSIQARSVIHNPSSERLRELVARMLSSQWTRHGNLNVQTRVTARSKHSTFFVSDHPGQCSGPTISAAEGQRLARLQQEHVAERDMLVVDGYIGDDPGFRTPARLIVDSASANIAAMQEILFFEVPQELRTAFHPALTVICTPDLGGRVLSTQAGCLAHTPGLRPEEDASIFRAVTSPRAYLENVAQDEDGNLDFLDTSYTPNGRAAFSLKQVRGVLPASDVGPVDFLVILGRTADIGPAVAKLAGAQAAAFFLLGETLGAGSATEAGRPVRIPGANPFFPLPHARQGNRFLDLLEKHTLGVYLMNTGRVGGAESVSDSKKIEVRHLPQWSHRLKLSVLDGSNKEIHNQDLPV